MSFNFYARDKRDLCTIITVLVSSEFNHILPLPVSFILLCFYIVTWHPFISAWRATFRISCKSVPVMMNSLNFCLSGNVLNVLVSPLFLKDNFPGVVFFVVFFLALCIYHPSLSAWNVSPEKLADRFLWG